jgi:hypothetical protein
MTSDFSLKSAVFTTLAKVTPEIYDNMKSQNFEDEQHSGFDALKQLRGIYSDKEVINLLNTVSENESPSNNIEPILMIYYNNKAPLPSYRPEVRLPKNSRQNTSSPLNTQRDFRVADIKPYLK